MYIAYENNMFIFIFTTSTIQFPIFLPNPLHLLLHFLHLSSTIQIHVIKYLHIIKVSGCIFILSILSILCYILFYHNIHILYYEKSIIIIHTYTQKHMDTEKVTSLDKTQK